LQRVLEQAGQFRLGAAGDATELGSALVDTASQFLVPAFVLVIAAALIANFAQNPPRFTPDKIAPDWDRVSLFAGWSRLVSARSATEFGKSLVKLGIVGFIAFLILKAEIASAFATLYSDPAGLADHLLTSAIRLISGIASAVVALAAADLLWSRMHWKADLRMSRQEVKDEMKQMQGDPIVKARMRSVALALSRKRMMSAVPTATLVIANPTHYAIALRYVRSEGGAPKVVAKGQDLIALKIREIAEQHDIPVIEDKALARSMYDRVEVDMMIPAEFYRVIAELVHFLTSRGASQPGN